MIALRDHVAQRLTALCSSLELSRPGLARAREAVLRFGTPKADDWGMPAVARNIVIEKGATFRLSCRLKSKGTGEYLDLTGFSGRMMVRARIDDATPALSAQGPDFTFDDEGRIRLKISDERTDAIEIVGGVYDLEIESPDGEVDRLFEGKVKIKPNVTRPDGTAP